MRITAATLHPYRLPLKAPWRSASGAFETREGWLLKLSTDVGLSAYGDCAPLPAAGTETREAAADQWRLWLIALPGRSVDECLRILAERRGSTPAARCALETALLDLTAQAAGLPLHAYLRGGADAATRGPTDVAVNAVIGTLDECCAQRTQAALDAGFTVLKLKLGLAPVQDELAALKRLATILPPQARLRLDANGAWDEATAGRMIAGLAGLPVESLEEPLGFESTPEDQRARFPAAHLAALHRLQAAAPFPLALDESLATTHWDELLATPPVKRLVLKPMTLGGPIAALRLGQHAQAAGLECIATTTLDSACGTLTAAHLAAALGNSLAHGLATSIWLAADIGAPLPLAGGRLALAATAGLGFSPLPSFLPAQRSEAAVPEA